MGTSSQAEKNTNQKKNDLNTEPIQMAPNEDLTLVAAEVSSCNQVDSPPASQEVPPTNGSQETPAKTQKKTKRKKSKVVQLSQVASSEENSRSEASFEVSLETSASDQ